MLCDGFCRIWNTPDSENKATHTAPQRIVEIVLLVAGVILFMVGMNASESFADQWSEFFTGHFTDKTVWYMVGGIALAIGGFILAMVGGRKGSA